MNRPSVAIIIAGVVIALAIVAARFLPVYQVFAATDGYGNPMLWRVNRITGEMQMCLAAGILQDKRLDSGTDPFARIAADDAAKRCQ